MTTTLSVGLVMSVAMSCGASDNALFRLQLESPVRTLRLNETANLSLAITGRGVGNITEGTEDLIGGDQAAQAFVQSLSFKPMRTGRYTFGPYSLAVNGQALTSNCVSVEVLPPWDGIYGTFFRVDTNSIVLGEEVELTVESWANTSEPRSINLAPNATFSSRGGGVSIASSLSGFKGPFTPHTQDVTTVSMSVRSDTGGTMRHTKQSWLIAPRQAGEFKIGRGMFKDLPQDAVGPDITIVVVEPKPRGVSGEGPGT